MQIFKGKYKNKEIGWQGIVVDVVYAAGTFTNMTAESFEFCFKLARTPFLKIAPRVYTDEVPMCTGMLAYARMEKVFKSKVISKWEAWQVWRKLV